ncbi:DUF397 domain-containing protein [Actinomadura atramentaria]|uniref:DUF397 domain-containing protein n=1 Tax=Actinomadura atramentaria TaxID=1990 RepID=UPI00036F9D0B|nr:DUF397 domain-containing protein [Actinomadura atramentaria]
MSSLSWRKSTRSNINGGECVELAREANTLHARDSKDPEAPHHRIPLPEAAAFIAGVKRGMYDL